MAVKFSNNGKTTLASGITNSATSITVNDGSVFPSLSGSDTFFMTLEDTSGNTEIVSVSAVSSNTLTVTRAQEGTTARAFSTGDKAENRLTAAGLNSFVSDSGDTMTGGLVVNADLTVDTNTLHVDSANNVVAVGTTSPSSAPSLQVQGDAEGIRLDGTADTSREIFFRNTSAANPASIHSDGALKLRAEDSGTHMEFHTADTERMRIDSSGNVGIGTTPASGVRLDMRSNAAANK